ncbi:MAG: hypothetical protein RML35_12125 [Chloroherpetonaceae bacterium]|nr:hypothetical protein [Chloroherpetonaceae bacterium]
MNYLTMHTPITNQIAYHMLKTLLPSPTWNNTPHDLTPSWKLWELL